MPKIAFVPEKEALDVDDIVSSLAKEIDRLPFTNGATVAYPTEVKEANDNTVVVTLSNGDTFSLKVIK